MSVQFWDPSLDKNPVEAGNALVKRANAIEDATENRLARNIALTSARLYENAPVMDLRLFGGGEMPAGSVSTTSTAYIGEHSTVNHLRAICMTAQSTIARNRVRPVFLSRGGDFDVQQKTERLTKLNDGIFSANNTHLLAAEIFIDAAAIGLGAIHVLHDSEKVIHERIFPTELLVDPDEARNGWQHVRTAGRRRRLDLDAAIGAFGDTPEKEAAIRTAAIKDRSVTGVNRIVVDEQWHKETPGQGDGRHSIAVKGMELFREKWPHQQFPIVIFVWEKSLLGIWGRSIAEQCSRSQITVNMNVSRTDRALGMASVPRLLSTKAPNGVAVPTAKINNKVGLIIELQPGQKIEDFKWSSNTAELQANTDWHIGQMWQLMGLSQPLGSGQSALGADASGAALRTEIQIVANRLANHQNRWDRVFVELAEVDVMVAKQLYVNAGKKNKKLTPVSVPGRKFAETIDWSTVSDLDSTDYIVDCEPTNKMASDPAGLIQNAIDLVTAKIWTPEQGARAIHTLDNEEPQSLTEASKQHLSKVFNGILETGKYEGPDDLDDLEAGVVLCAEYALRAINRGAPAKRVDQLRDWITEAAATLKRRKQAQQPPAAAPGLPAPPVPDGTAGAAGGDVPPPEEQVANG
jgi:hypothetical protein